MGNLGGFLAALLLAAPGAAAPPVMESSAEPPPVEATAPEEAAQEAPQTEAVAELTSEEEAPVPIAYNALNGSLESFDGLGWLRVSIRNSTMRARRGYSPLEVILQSSDAVPRQVTIEFSGYRPGSAAITRTVELGPRQRLATSLLIPAPLTSGSLRVTSPGFKPQQSNGAYLYQASGLSALVIGNQQGFEHGTALPHAEEDQAAHVGAVFLTAQQAPRELAAYVGYDLVMVTEEVASLPPDVWTSLENHAAVGGSLMIALPPRDIRQRLPLLPAGEGHGPWTAYGLGQVALCAPGAAGCSAALNGLSAKRGLPIQPREFTQGDMYDRRLALGEPSEAAMLPNAMAPLGRFLVLIFLFTLMVGPGGLYLARRRGPVALLLGVPAVALVTCLLIVADSVLREGFVTHTARYSYTLLDRPRDRLITAAVAGYYANLASGPIQVPAQGVLLASDDASEWELGVDWSGGGMKAEGFLPARTYLEWGELAVVPTRARLIVRSEGSRVKVQNALGASLQKGFVRLGGVHYALGEAADGEELVAKPVTGWEKTPLSTHLPIASPLAGRSRQDLAFLAPLEDGEFVVRLGGAGFSFLASLPSELHEGAHYVRGKVDGP
ncbi:hypothetical protein [Stigmatella aurantiaca]|uniref:Conserved uncharacterized protein n=1 Tax=Stigmatella aurantiaca (strain DW4/3-1) TaxID=378806 RepID=E3G0Q1_STIAD|nr:hypothetical protein [Stigmatella aurantiaca]ADO74999.1 conserved uncharacterized protein [Stigmatella aurantiaca DW4/3-1]